MTFETLLYGVEEGVAILKLDRPEHHNACNETMARELAAVWSLVKRDPEVVCAIVTGVGNEAFCAGMDPADARWPGLTAIRNGCWKPVVTAVNGLVADGGLHFAADSDLVLASENATFVDTRVARGLVAGIEPVELSRRIPFEAVMRLALLGGSEPMDAREAHRLGLVGEVVPADRLMPRARELAARIARHSPTALALTKRAIWQGLETGLDEALESTEQTINDHTAHPDFREGALAVLEKRKPRWAPYTGE